METRHCVPALEREGKPISSTIDSYFDLVDEGSRTIIGVFDFVMLTLSVIFILSFSLPFALLGFIVKKVNSKKEG